MTNQEFYHEGKKGQKWGQRNYQNKDGTWTALGKARRRKGIGGGRKESLSSRLVKRARLTLGKGKKSSGTSEGEAQPKPKKPLTGAEKSKIVESGDAKLVKKHVSELSTEEIQRAINKINKTKELNAIIKEQEPKKKTLNERVRNLADLSKSVSDLAKSANDIKNLYNENKNKKEQKSIEKIVNSGDLSKIMGSLSKMTESQAKSAKAKYELTKEMEGIPKKLRDEKKLKKLEKVINSGNASEVEKHIGEMTDSQAKTAKSKIETSEAIRYMAQHGYDKWRKREKKYKQNKGNKGNKNNNKNNN